MGKSAGAAPAAPDPEKLVGLQSAADQKNFNTQLEANRYNTVGTDSSTSWGKQITTDQGAYDKALADWEAGKSKGTWVPGQEASPEYWDGESGTFKGGAATAGYWDGAGISSAKRPEIADYTSDKWTQTTQLTPEQQKLHDLNQSSSIGQAGLLAALTERLKGTYGKDIDWSGLTGIKTSTGTGDYESRLSALDPSQYNQQAGDAVYNQQNRYFTEAQGESQRALEARLSEQGFVPGTPAYEKAMNQFQDNTNQSRADMRDRATTQGYSVGDQQFGNARSALTDAASLRAQDNSFNNTSRTQQIAELLQQRAQPLNEINAIRQGTQQMTGQAPAASSGGNASLGNLDVMGAYGKEYQGLLDKYNADVGSDNAKTATAGSVIGMIAAAFI